MSGKVRCSEGEWEDEVHVVRMYRGMKNECFDCKYGHMKQLLSNHIQVHMQYIHCDWATCQRHPEWHT